MNIDELLIKYEVDARARGYSPRTISHVKRCIGFFADFLGGIPDTGEINADDLRRFLSNLRDRQVRTGGAAGGMRTLSQTSINTYARAIKSFWSWLKQAQIIRENPLATVKAPKKPKTIPRVYYDEEIRAVMDTVSKIPREKAMVELLLDSGIRLEELVALQISDIDLTQGRLRVFGKGQKQRFAYFSRQTAESLKNYLNSVRPKPTKDNNLFLTVEGSPLIGKSIQTILERVGRNAGITRRLSAHSLRHTYATLALKYGSNLEYVRITLGHADVNTTSESYLNVADKDIAAAFQKFSPVANLIATSEKKAASNDMIATAGRILESEINLIVKPASHEPLPTPTSTCKLFVIPTKSAEIYIESLQAVTTDPVVDYRLLLFPFSPPENTPDLDCEDLIAAETVKKRSYTYYPETPLRYVNLERSSRVYGGICIGQRPLRFDLDSVVQKEAYYGALVTYTITIRYRLKPSSES